nr:uncharacterized protein LOC121120215 isoform X1 [Lepeophtheirus salmonis]
MIKSEKGHLEDPSTIYQGFLQIPPKEIKCYHNLTYIFDIPSQNPDVLSHISNTTFYICLHRKIDKRTSDPIKAFQFIDDFTKDLLTTLTQEVIDSEEDEAFFCNSLESGFVSSEPSPLMNIPNNYPLTPNNDLFHSCMDIDITDMNICNFPMDPDYISMDKGKNTYSSAEKKDFDTLTNILKVSSGISINRRTKVSEVTGFPTLRIRNSREDKESNVNSPDLCDPDENKYTKSVHELYTKQKLYVGAALIIIIGLIFFVIYRLR